MLVRDFKQHLFLFCPCAFISALSRIPDLRLSFSPILPFSLAVRLPESHAGLFTLTAAFEPASGDYTCRISPRTDSRAEHLAPGPLPLMVALTTLDGEMSVETEVNIPFVPAFSVNARRTQLSPISRTASFTLSGLYNVEDLIVQVGGASVTAERRMSNRQFSKWHLGTVTLKQAPPPADLEVRKGIVHMNVVLGHYAEMASANETVTLMHRVTGQRKTVEIHVAHEAALVGSALGDEGGATAVGSGKRRASASPFLPTNILLLVAVVLLVVLVIMAATLLREQTAANQIQQQQLNTSVATTAGSPLRTPQTFTYTSNCATPHQSVRRVTPVRRRPGADRDTSTHQ